MSKVEWKTLGDVVDYIRGVTYSKQDEVYFPDNEPVYRVLRSNNITIKSNTLNFSDLKYISQRVKIKKNQILSKGDILICAGNGSTEHIGKVAFINESIDYTFGGFMGVIRCKDSAYSKYLYYILCSTIFKNFLRKNFNGGAINNLNADLLYKFRFPLTDLFAIKQIVSQLDTFTTLIAKLERELELRQKQYEFYREELYGDLWAIAEKGNNKGLIQIKSFSEIGDIIRGKRFVRDDIKEQGQPCIHYGDMYTYYGVSATETKTFLDYDFPKTMRYAEKGDVVIVGAGENNSDIGVGVAWLGDEKAAVHDACYILKHALDAKYVSHYLRTNIYHQQLKKYVSEGKICSFSSEGLGKVLLPVPFQAESYRQQQIVTQLDTFEQLISALKREIALRRKQYEYYREKLLTFD